MTSIGHPVTLHGGCHCTRVGIQWVTRLDLKATNPRACDCSFCQKHGAAYVSDPSGALRIIAAEPGLLHAYRQGSDVARFQLCGRCGVLVGVVFEHHGTTYGAVNVGCLDERSLFAASVPASPRQLSPQEKISRWLHVWIPDVRMVVPVT